MITFNNIPTNIRVPGAYLEVDNSNALKGLLPWLQKALLIGWQLPSDPPSRARPCSLNYIQDFANSSRHIILDGDLPVRDSLSMNSH